MLAIGSIVSLGNIYNIYSFLVLVDVVSVVLLLVEALVSKYSEWFVDILQ